MLQTADMDSLPDQEYELVTSCLESIGRDPRTLRGGRLLAGGSGSAVVLLRLDDPTPEVVLKVTTAPEWRERAERELRFLTESGDRLPIASPRVLGNAVSANQVCLLISIARPSAPPGDWSTERWLEIAHQLGTLHHQNTLTVIPSMDWMRRSNMAIPPDLIEPALTYWRRVDRDQLVGSLLAQEELLEQAATALPLCLLHGDCHADNLLLDERERPVFADWQEVQLGHGTEDLSLLWQRAEVDGAAPPRLEMLRAYARARELWDEDALRRSATASELLLLLVQWPVHLARAALAKQRIMVNRLDQLAIDWERCRADLR